MIKKDHFLNIAIHELRTPMKTIRWYLSMLIDWDIWKINIDAKNYLEKIYNNIEKYFN